MGRDGSDTGSPQPTIQLRSCRLWEGGCLLTIVVVTHDPVVSARADRIVHVRDGVLNAEPAPVP